MTAQATQTGPGAVVHGAWTNWFGNETCYPDRIESPRTEAEIQECVATAARDRVSVRVAGSGHSLPPVVLTDGMLLDLTNLGGMVRTEPEFGRATVPSGARMEAIWEPLWDAGCALQNTGALQAATVGGVVSTGVHGSGLKLQSTSANVPKLRLVLASSEVLEVTRETPELLRAAQIAMGMLGVITEVTLDVVPAYHLHERSFFLSVDELIERWHELATSHRHFSIWYLPHRESARFYSLRFRPGDDDLCYVIVRDAVDPDASQVKLEPGDRLDRMYRILTFDIDESRYRDLRDLEFFVPFENSRATFSEMRQRIRERFRNTLPIEIRFVAEDDALLTQYSGGPRAAFGLTAKPDSDWRTYLDEFEALFLSEGGLPHWGKRHSVTPAELEVLFPKARRFTEIRRELDPTGMFLNAYLREFFE